MGGEKKVGLGGGGGGGARGGGGEPVFPYSAARSAANLVGQIPESQILVQLYDKIRTYFERN